MAAPLQASSHVGRFSSSVRDVTDTWQHGLGITNWSHRLEQLTSRPFFGRTRELWLGPIQVIHEWLNQPFVYSGFPWKGSRLFAVFLPHNGSPYCDGRSLAAGQLETHPWDAIERVVCSSGVECVVVAIDEEFLSAKIEPALGCNPLGGLRRPAILSSDPVVTQEFCEGILDLLDTVQEDPSLITADHGRRSLQAQTLDTVMKLLEEAGHSVDDLPRSSTRAYVVEKATEFMEARLSQPIALADVCTGLRISARTLRYSFEQVLGVSPARYLLARRLNGVRRDLICGDRAGTIEEVAVRWGFWHMSRFAQFYRETFGERPSETLRRLRPAAPGRARIAATA